MDVIFDTRPNGVTIVSPRGRLDLLSAPDLKQRIGELIGDGNIMLVVDLMDISFIDSSGLGVLIGALKSSRRAGGDLRIARPSEQATMILELTTLDRVLRPYTSLEEACAGFAQDQVH